MPGRQGLVGIWLLTWGSLLFAGLLTALWLDGQLAPAGTERALLWVLAALPGGMVAIAGPLLERRLLAPLRHLAVQLDRWSAAPDAREDFPPEGWLSALAGPLQAVRDLWRHDRGALVDARDDGAREADRIRRELEAVLQALDLPLILVDRHQRLLMFNPAASQLLEGEHGLGLGRRLDGLLPASSLSDALAQIAMAHGHRGEILIPLRGRWLRCTLHRVGGAHGEVLISLEDSTRQQAAERQWREPLSRLLPALRRNAAALRIGSEALRNTAAQDPLREKLELVLETESQALAGSVQRLAGLIEAAQQHDSQLHDTWSNDIWTMLAPAATRLGVGITPIGIPAWLRADAPSLLAMLERVIERLADALGVHAFDAEVRLGNRRVYLDLVWPGKALDERLLVRWRALQLADAPLAPTVEDVLLQHDSDWWSLTEGEYGRLRIPLPAAVRVGPPAPHPPPRPELHDFSIAELPPPDAELAARALRHLEVVVIDTETTGLNLARGDSVVSIGACRVVGGRLLASEVFDRRVNPQRPIPPESTRFHGLTDADVEGAPPLAVVLPQLRAFIGDAVLLAHNAAFDLTALRQGETAADVRFDMPVLDTWLLARGLGEPRPPGYGLDELAEHYGLCFPPGTRHTALGDARVTAELWLALLPRLAERGTQTLEQALALQRQAEQAP